MKPLILITSCHSYRQQGYEDAVRETWAKNCSVDYRFVLGSGQGPGQRNDEWFFDVPDDYAHVTLKTIAGHARAIGEGYGFVFQCFLDTYVNVPQMLRSDFRDWDYVGFFKGHDGEPPRIPDSKGRYPYACGGAGYWLSRKACEVVANSPVDLADDQTLALWAEDLWVGTVLGRAGIFGHNEPRYREPGRWYVEFGAELFSAHLGCGTGNYRPDQMREAHRRVLNPR